MPTTKPRIYITLDEITYQALSDLADVSGIPRSSWAALMLTRNAQLFGNLAAAMKQAKSDPAGAMTLLQDLTNDVTISAAQMSLDVAAMDTAKSPPRRKATKKKAAKKKATRRKASR